MRCYPRAIVADILPSDGSTRSTQPVGDSPRRVDPADRGHSALARVVRGRPPPLARPCPVSTPVDLSARLENAAAGRYRIVRELGRGGMATVFLARDGTHERMVAIKMLQPELSAAVTAERFTREIRLLATLQHPNILPLYDSGTVDGVLYYVMPFVAGESLRDRITREGRLPVPLALRIAEETAAALDYAHRQGVIHRDIKPENILLSDEHVLVADFGIARAAMQSADDRLTITSLIVGTPAYMSPEQASGDATLDGRSDIYSLACVLYEMLAGEPPFTGRSAAATMAARFAGVVPRVASRRPDVPAHVDDAIAAAMALTAELRPPTPAAFADRLRDAGSRAPSHPFRTGHRGLMLRGAAALGLAAVIGAALWLGLARWRGAGSAPIALAVLPLDVEGATDDNRYLGEGLADELTDALSGMPGLRVTSRTAAFQFRGSQLGLPEIGRRLGVRILIGGFIQPRGRSMHVTVELTNARTGARIQTVAVDQDTTDPLGLQARVARSVADALSLRLSERDSARFTKRHTIDPEAHDRYLRGRYFFDRLEAGAHQKAIAQFNAAIARDSLYAQAWTGLAEVYASIGIGNVMAGPPRENFERARAAAMRALEIDSTIAQAHADLGLVRMMYDYDWRGAAAELDRAQRLDAGNMDTYLYRSFLYSWQGRFEDAATQSATALRLAPTTLRVLLNNGFELMQGRRYRAADSVLAQAMQLDSTHGRVAEIYGENLLAAGRTREALSTLDQASRLLPTSSRVAALRAAALAATGNHAAAARLVDSLQSATASAFVSEMDLAIARVGVGDKTGALASLERAYRQRTLRPRMRDPVFDPLRSEPRYVALLDTLRLRH